MDPDAKFADIRHLARMAARLAGQDPDEHVVVRIGGVIAFDDLVWRYPVFLARAENVYESLRCECPLSVTPPEHKRSSAA